MSNENPTVYGEVGVGSYILNDYVLTVEESDEGYVLNIKKGSEEQTAQILIGPKGDAGVSITSAVLNSDYTLTIEFSNGSSYTTPNSIRGPQGERGEDGKDGIVAVSIDTHIRWLQGWYGRSSGLLDPQTTAISSEILPLDVISVSCTDEAIHFKLHGWEKGAYRGQWRGDRWSTGSGDYYITSIDLKPLLYAYPNYVFALTAFKKDGSTLDTSAGQYINIVRSIFSYTEENAYNMARIAYGGFDISPKKHGIIRATYNATLPGKAAGTTSRQAMDIYDNTIYIINSDDKLLVVDLATMTKKANLI